MKAWKSLKKKLTKRSNNYNPNSVKDYSAGSPDNPENSNNTHENLQNNFTINNKSHSTASNHFPGVETDGCYHYQENNDSLRFFTAPGAPQAPYQISNNSNMLVPPNHKMQPSAKISAFFSKPRSKKFAFNGSSNLKQQFVNFNDGGSSNGTESSNSESGNGTGEGISDNITESDIVRVGESDL